MPAACILALWLGIMTSVSPCPLATNIAAISFISTRPGRRRGILLSGLTYTLGRSAAYVALGFVIARAVLAAPEVSWTLQKHMNRIIGPLMILVGMVLLGLIRLSFRASIGTAAAQKRAEKGGLAAAAMLGAVFALSFCPTSAALFFGVLIPQALDQRSSILLPSLYGVGTAVPVIVFAVLLAHSTQLAGAVFRQMARIERWVRYAAGAIFIAAGIYYCLVFIFRLSV